MKNIIATIALIAGLFLLISLVSIGGTFLQLEYMKFFNPQFADVERQVFEKTRSYNQAKIQELSKYRYEYYSTENQQTRALIASTVRHRFADYRDYALSPELLSFLGEVNSP